MAPTRFHAPTTTLGSGSKSSNAMWAAAATTTTATATRSTACLHTIIDGAAISKSLKAEVKEAAARVTQMRDGVPPGLGVVIVGERKDSQSYVRSKAKAGAAAGLRTDTVALPETATQTEILSAVEALNQDEGIDAILVQLPLPDGIDSAAVIDAVDWQKDADGFHVRNVGLLGMKDRVPASEPCTPRGIMTMLDKSNTPLEGKTAVVIGNSDIVGRPMTQLLLKAGAAVIMTSESTSLEEMKKLTLCGDIVVVGVGIAGYLKADWIKPGATVIDVGINAVPDDTKKSGFRLVGDADFDAIITQVPDVKISPVPGGVGPMTIATLLSTTVALAERNATAATA